MITKDDPKYRTLYLNNPKLQHTVLAFDGGLEFLYNLGFEPHVEARDKLMCHEVNSRVVQACLICLEDKIESLSYDEYEQQKEQNQMNQWNNGMNNGMGNGMNNGMNHQMNHQMNSQMSHQMNSPMNHQSNYMNSNMNSNGMNSGMNGYGPNNNQMNQPPPAKSLDPYGVGINGMNSMNMNFSYDPQNGQYGQQFGGQQSDTNQVMNNLQAMGFNPSKSAPDSSYSQSQHSQHPQHQQYGQHQHQFDSQYPSDSYSPNFKGKKEPKRPVPLPPIRGRNNGDSVLSDQWHSDFQSSHQSQDSGQVRDSVIDRNVWENLANGNKSKIDHVMGLKNHRKMYKTFIFIRHGNSIWNKFKAGGKKRKMAALFVGVQEYIKLKSNPENHADTWVVDAPLSRIGIDEVFCVCVRSD